MSQALAVRLHGRRIGTLSNLGGDYNLFSFDEEYLADPARPVLSQAFIGASGDTLRVVPRTHRIAPAFFSNLLPENGSLLRAMVARQYRLNGTRDFPFLRVLGSDLPGAVVIGEPLPSHEDDPVLVETLHEGERPLRFSLAGMQLKFSAGMSGERLTIPVGGQAGTWIAKLPTNAFPGLPENEFAVMSLARASGLPVPKILTIALDAIDHLPDGLPSLRSDEPAQAYVIERFDRTSEGGRVHAEDFNQIADQQPSDKYDHKTSSWIANVIATICPPEDLDDFVRRLVFGVCVGNDDMHLKNWAVVYPDGHNARLAPMYDFVCTRQYFPAGNLALTIGGERSFARIGREALREFAKAAEISARRILVIADEIVAAIHDVWPRVRDEIDQPAFVEAIERNFAAVPVMLGQ